MRRLRMASAACGWKGGTKDRWPRAVSRPGPPGPLCGPFVWSGKSENPGLDATAVMGVPRPPDLLSSPPRNVPYGLLFCAGSLASPSSQQSHRQGTLLQARSPAALPIWNKKQPAEGSTPRETHTIFWRSQDRRAVLPQPQASQRQRSRGRSKVCVPTRPLSNSYAKNTP